MITTIDNSLPLLEADTELQVLLKELDQQQESLSLKQREVDEKIQGIQQSCTHPGFTEERTRKDSYDEINMLISKTCKDCGLKLLKPEGEPYKVCENCWGPMKYDGYEPGQGGGTRHYECESCKHESSHT